MWLIRVPDLLFLPLPVAERPQIAENRYLVFSKGAVGRVWSVAFAASRSSALVPSWCQQSSRCRAECQSVGAPCSAASASKEERHNNELSETPAEGKDTPMAMSSNKEVEDKNTLLLTEPFPKSNSLDTISSSIYNSTEGGLPTIGRFPQAALLCNLKWFLAGA